MALAFAPLGAELRITKILTDEKTRRHLENLGLIVGGSIVSVTDRDGSVILSVKGGRLALNKALAMKILVA